MRKIFLDCGAHKGESIDVFLRCFDKNNEFEIYSFEPNPQLKNYFKKYKKLDNFTFINKAVWIKDGFIDFYGLDEGPRRDVGCTINKNKIDISHNEPIRVESLSLSNWIKSNFNVEDYIILKLDIEGAEYDIINNMIKENTFDYINKFYVEFHVKWMKNTEILHKNTIENLKNNNINYYFWDALNPAFKPNNSNKI